MLNLLLNLVNNADRTVSARNLKLDTHNCFDIRTPLTIVFFSGSEVKDQIHMLILVAKLYKKKRNESFVLGLLKKKRNELFVLGLSYLQHILCMTRGLYLFKNYLDQRLMSHCQHKIFVNLGIKKTQLFCKIHIFKFKIYRYLKLTQHCSAWLIRHRQTDSARNLETVKVDG